MALPQPEDLRRMRQFNEMANKLRRSTFAREMATKPSGLTISWQDGDVQPKAEVYGPADETVDAMILTLRFMIQDSDECSLRRMADTYEKLPPMGWTVHRANFLDARSKVNDYLDRDTSLVWKHKDPSTGKIDHDETLTNRRVLELVVYGERAHTNREKAFIVSSLRSWEVGSAFLNNTFNVVAANLLDAVFYLQIQNAALHEEMTGEKLAIEWPVVQPPFDPT